MREGIGYCNKLSPVNVEIEVSEESLQCTKESLCFAIRLRFFDPSHYVLYSYLFQLFRESVLPFLICTELGAIVSHYLL